MKWKYDLSTIRRAVNHDGRVEVDQLEALRAIAEQLERAADAFEHSKAEVSRAVEEVDVEIAPAKARAEPQASGDSPPQAPPRRAADL